MQVINEKAYILAYIVSLLIHLLFFLVGPLVLSSFYKNTEVLKKPPVVEINITFENDTELERKELTQHTEIRRIHEQRKQNIHIQSTSQVNKTPLHSLAQKQEQVVSTSNILQGKNQTPSTSQVNEAPPPSAQKQDQVVSTTNILQGKDQRGDTELHTEGYQQSSKKIEGKSGSGESYLTSGSQTGDVQKELFLKEKISVISSLIQRNIKYPPIARKMGWEGKVIVCFKLTPDGRVEDLHVLESSGYEILDKSAIEAVSRNAHLFPKPPAEVLIKLPVNFKLE